MVNFAEKLLEASSLKRSVTEGVHFMIVRELAGGLFIQYKLFFNSNCLNRNGYIMKFKTLGLYYGKPRGFGINEEGEETGFCTEIYSSSEVYFN